MERRRTPVTAFERTRGRRTVHQPGVPSLVLLGGIEFWDGAAEVPLPGSAGAVVALLALASSPTRRAVVAGTIWVDAGEERALGNLRSTLWRLKRAAPGLVESHDGLLSIAGTVAVDHRTVGDWADRLVRGDPLESDLDVVPSPADMELMPGCYEDWAVFERERLRQRLLHATESLARLLAARGRHAEAIEAALSAVAADPLRESAHRVAIECHVAEHNMVEARRQQLAYARLLRAELGIEPSGGFMALLPDSLAQPLVEPGADLAESALH